MSENEIEKDAEIKELKKKLCEKDDLIKKLNSTLQESEDKFRNIFYLSPIVIGISTMADGRYIDVNRSFEHFFGFTKQEVIGKTTTELGIWVNPDDRSKLIELLVQKGHLYNQEFKLKDKNGKIHTTLFSAVIIQLENQRCLMVSINDITTWRDVEVEKQDLTSINQSIIDNANDVIALLDLNLKFLMINRKGLEKIGYTKNEIENMTVFDIVEPETHRIIKEMVLKKISGQYKNTIYDIEILPKNQQKILFEFSTTLISRNEKPYAILLIARDISYRKRVEIEHVRTQKLESIGILAGGIAHDFNNILAGILGQLNIIQMESENDPELKLSLSELEKAIYRARDLTKQLLTFSKGGNPIKKITALKQVIIDSTEFALRGSNCVPVISIQKDLWDSEIDSGQINQVINNLVLNAVQATPKGGEIFVSALNVEGFYSGNTSNREGKYIKISVEDHGIGISKENIDNIFNPYFTTKPTGTGLGLITCYSIIKQHGGWITFDSKENIGTIFTFYLPASPHKVDPNLPKTVIINNNNIATPDVKGRILVMDDEETIRKMLDIGLRQLNYDVTTVIEGNEAIASYKAALEHHPYDVIILDLTIKGGMGGLDTMNAIKSLDPNVIGVVISGYSNDQVLANYKDYGFSAMLQKPFNLKELIAILVELIKNKELSNS